MMLTASTSTAGFKLYTCVPACLPLVNLQNSSATHTLNYTQFWDVYTISSEHMRHTRDALEQVN